MSVQNLILFCSTTSQACVPCLQFVYKNKLQVQVVRLDTSESRNRASQGKYFQIHAVPTLVVIRSGGDLQLFVGQSKVGKWLQNMMVPRRPKPQKKSTKVVYYSDSSGSEAEFIDPPAKGLYDKPRKMRKHKKSKRRKKKKKYIDSDEEEEIEIEFVDQPNGRRPPPPTDGLMLGSLATKKSSGPSIFDLAKQMETQRKNSLGYKEEDLPVNSY